MTASTMPQVLSDVEMYDLILASDANWDGKFYFGVVTTGIYCRPSCRVRKPLRENVRFFNVPQEARAAGLRPCRRCYPDDFAAGEDPARDEIDALVAEVRSEPARFPDVEAVVARSGYGATHLFESFRRFLGTTPAAALNEARIEYARRLLSASDAPVMDVALAAGYHSASVFHRRFKLVTGLTPRAYRLCYKESA